MFVSLKYFDALLSKFNCDIKASSEFFGFAEKRKKPLSSFVFDD